MNIEAGHQQHGFVAVASIFILVVLALLGALMLSTVTTQNVTTSQSQREIQAWFAAQSGIDWAIQQLLVAGTSCATVNGSSFAPPGTATNYVVAITCVSTNVVEAGGPPYDVYRVWSRASSGNAGRSDYVSRTVRATVSER